MNFTNEAARISAELNISQQMCKLSLIYGAQMLLLDLCPDLPPRAREGLAKYSAVLLEAGAEHLLPLTEEQQDRLANAVHEAIERELQAARRLREASRVS